MSEKEVDYSRQLIKQYTYWGVYVFDNQNYLGRCVIWCDRDNALQLTDAIKEEQDELFEILRKLKAATEKAFDADWYNFAFLGNVTSHLHGHFVPRYESKRKFAGMDFEDKLWGKKYQTDKDFVTPAEVLEKVRLEIKKYLD